jgi:predicted phosphate transport protein (TIGR00153 family)
MMSWFVPREAKFFNMFRESADLIVDGAKELINMINDLNNLEDRARNIKEIEHMADKVTHQAVESLHKTFITPLDREDIYRLITKMDDILDFIEGSAQRFHLYDIRTVTPEVHELADIILRSAEDVKAAVAGLENMKNSPEILKRCVQINSLENEADHIMRTGMAKLFRENHDIKDLIKLKEIYEMLESVTDRCEDVANIIEGIVLDHA